LAVAPQRGGRELHRRPSPAAAGSFAPGDPRSGIPKASLTEPRRRRFSPKRRGPHGEAAADPLRAEGLAGAAGPEAADEADVLPYPNGDAAEASPSAASAALSAPLFKDDMAMPPRLVQYCRRFSRWSRRRVSCRWRSCVRSGTRIRLPLSEQSAAFNYGTMQNQPSRMQARTLL